MFTYRYTTLVLAVRQYRMTVSFVVYDIISQGIAGW